MHCRTVNNLADAQLNQVNDDLGDRSNQQHLILLVGFSPPVSFPIFCDLTAILYKKKKKVTRLNNNNKFQAIP